MSRSFTSRPGFTNTRGRGRGTQSRQIQAVNANRLDGVDRETGARPRVAQPQIQPAFGRARMYDEHEDTEEPRVDEMQESNVERRMTYQGGYSMIAPNQRKRQEINQVAQREEQAYQAHKQKNTPKSFSYVGTAGGGQTQIEARRKLVLENPSKTQKLLQKEQRKSYFKLKDDEEIQKKKEEQRKKDFCLHGDLHEENMKYLTTGFLSGRHTVHVDKLANEAFLRRLENKNKRQAGAQAPASTRSTQKYFSAQEPASTRSTQSTYPSQSAERLQPAQAFGTSASVAIATNDSSGAYEDIGPAESQRVSQLASIFPQYSRAQLLEILEHVDFSLDSAVAILQD